MGKQKHNVQRDVYKSHCNAREHSGQKKRFKVCTLCGPIKFHLGARGTLGAANDSYPVAPEVI